jgi:subtilisin family serine protease
VHLKLVRLTALMQRTSGRPDVVIGLIDGPVTQHADLATNSRRAISEHGPTTCLARRSVACLHGTFVAGILTARRGSSAPAIAPGCSLIVRPIFSETNTGHDNPTTATAPQLARAIVQTIDAGANVINLSLGLAAVSPTGQRDLEDAIDLAVRRGVIVVVAAGNQGAVGGSVLTQHPWVIPVVACDLQGGLVGNSNLGASIGRGGLRAPGQNIRSLAASGGSTTLNGTSVAAPFVTGAVALLWSEFPTASAMDVRRAIIYASGGRRTSIVPPLMDAEAAYTSLNRAIGERRSA